MPGIGFFAWSDCLRTSKTHLYLKTIVRLSISPKFSPKQKKNLKQQQKEKKPKSHSLSDVNILLGQTTLALKNY